MLGNEQLTLIGHIGQDASIKEYQGKRFVTFSLAVDKGYKNGHGDWVSATNWWSVIIRNENLVPHLKKGKYIQVQGEPRIKTFRNQQGDVLPALNLNADSIHFLKQAKPQEETRSHATGQNSGPHPSSQLPTSQYEDLTGTQVEDDELPF